MIVRKDDNNPRRDGRKLRRQAIDLYPALKALGRVTVKADPSFTKEATGMGDIEYFAPGQKVIRYPTGEEFKHPGPDRRPAVLVNPETNTAQTVALDMLHGMAEADPKFREMRNLFAKQLDPFDINYWFDHAVAKGHANEGDFEQFRENYIDGKLRNLLFEGTREEFRQARYNPDERMELRQVPDDYGHTYQHARAQNAITLADEIRKYLKGEQTSELNKNYKGEYVRKR